MTTFIIANSLLLPRGKASSTWDVLLLQQYHTGFLSVALLVSLSLINISGAPSSSVTHPDGVTQRRAAGLLEKQTGLLAMHTAQGARGTSVAAARGSNRVLSADTERELGLLHCSQTWSL